MPALIAYFSRAGNNYVNGNIVNLPVGNTELAAQMLAQLTESGLYKIDPLLPYSGDYRKCVEQARQDWQHNARPKLKHVPDSLDPYDIIYLGYPNYCGTMPMAVFTFLEQFDFSGKIIKPFCTHEGSGMGGSERDIRRLCPGAKVQKGLAIHGAYAGSALPALKAWIQN